MVKKVPLLAAAMILIAPSLLAQAIANLAITAADVEAYLDLASSASLEEMAAKINAAADQDRIGVASQKIGFYAGMVLSGLNRDLAREHLLANDGLNFTPGELDLLEPYADRLAAAAGDMARMIQGR